MTDVPSPVEGDPAALASWTDLGRGLVAGWLADQVDGRGAFPIWVGWSVAGLGLILAIIAGGVVRGLGLLLVFVGIIVALLALLVRGAAKAAIRRFATPRSIAGKHEEIDAALSDADLPTGPLSIARFLWRVRRGVGSERRRLEMIVNRLRVDLVAADPDIATLAPPPAPTLPPPPDRGVHDA